MPVKLLSHAATSSSVGGFELKKRGEMREVGQQAEQAALCMHAHVALAAGSLAAGGGWSAAWLQGLGSPSVHKGCTETTILNSMLLFS